MNQLYQAEGFYNFKELCCAVLHQDLAAADDTLEARLEAQHDWFLENAGLEINI